MSTPYLDIDLDGLLEYSVVFTERSLNQMSARFRGVMAFVTTQLRETYGARAAAVVPGGGTVAMESVARQFGTGQRCMVIRTGYFGYRWTQIFRAGSIPEDEFVITARPTHEGRSAPFTPPPIADVTAAIREFGPHTVFAAHVETSSGICLPDAYMRAVADAARAVDAILVLDSIASGAAWVSMEDTGVDILISAPQKGWSSSPCAGLVMLGDRALERMQAERNTGFSCDLSRWLQVARAYESGGHAYHCTLPTDSIVRLSESIAAMSELGMETARSRQVELGSRVRRLLGEHGFPSVAAPGFEAAAVVVSHTDRGDIHDGSAFARAGLQIAAGLPLHCGEGDDFRSFRLGLFGLDKLTDVDRTVQRLADAVYRVGTSPPDGNLAAGAGS